MWTSAPASTSSRSPLPSRRNWLTLSRAPSRTLLRVLPRPLRIEPCTGVSKETISRREFALGASAVNGGQVLLQDCQRDSRQRRQQHDSARDGGTGFQALAGDCRT